MAGAIGSFNIDGLASGLDTTEIISKLMAVEQIPLLRMQSQKADINLRLPEIQNINTLLLSFKNLAADLKIKSTFQTRIGSSSDTGLVSMGKVGSTAQTGTHTINSITRLATATVATSNSRIGGNIDSSVALSSSKMQTDVKTGTFSINGGSFYVDASTDSLDDIITRINNMSGTTGVQAVYDSATDKFSLENVTAGDTSVINLGASGDTSNFLTATGMLGGYQDTSSGKTVLEMDSHLGAVRTEDTLIGANFATAVTSGSIIINGVSIAVNATTDTLDTLMDRINTSNAGVTASYDQLTDKLKFTRKETGEPLINFGTGTSNFLDIIKNSTYQGSTAVSPTTYTGTDSFAVPVYTGTQAVSTISYDGASPVSGDVPLLNVGTLSTINTTVSYSGTNPKILVSGNSGSKTVNLNGGDTIQVVLDKINAWKITTGVEANYDQVTGEFIFTNIVNSDPISVTNSAGNFLQQFQLDGAVTDPTGELRSHTPIADFSFTVPMLYSNTANPVTAGAITITQEGQAPALISYNPATESMQDIVDFFSANGLDLNYDAVGDRFQLSLQNPSGPGITVDDSGTFLTAMGLSNSMGLANPATFSSTVSLDQYTLGGPVAANQLTFTVDGQAPVLFNYNPATTTMGDLQAEFATHGIDLTYDTITGKYQVQLQGGGASVTVEDGVGGDLLTALGLPASMNMLNPGDFSATMTLDQYTFSAPIAAGSLTFTVDGQAPVVVNYDPAVDTLDSLRTTFATYGLNLSFDDVTGKFNVQRVDGTTPSVTVVDSDSVNGILPALSLPDTMNLVNPADFSSSFTLDQYSFGPSITAGQLSFTVDGQPPVLVNYDPATDTMADLQAAFAASGLTLIYNSTAEKYQVQLQDGNPAVTVEESGAGNFLTAIGLPASFDIASSQIAGQNAEYELDGNTYYSNSNTIDNRIDGVTFTLAAESAAPATLTFASESSDAMANIKEFVDKYNEILTKINEVIKDEGGVLESDTGLRDVMATVKRLANQVINTGSNYDSLSSIGITSGEIGQVFSEDYMGLLEIDEDALKAALEDDPDGVANLFYFDPTGGASYSEGIGKLFEKALAPLTNPNGTLDRRVRLMGDDLDDLDRRIADLQANLDMKEGNLRRQFTNLEIMMGQLQRQGQWLNSQLGSMGSFGA